jgi:hypothetical protein
VRETADEIDVLRETRSGAVFTADIDGGVAPGLVGAAINVGEV